MDTMIKAWGEAQQLLATPSSQHISRSLSEQSITIIKDDQQALPIRPDQPILVIWPKISVTTEVDEIFLQSDRLAEKLSTLGAHPTLPPG